MATNIRQIIAQNLAQNNIDMNQANAMLAAANHMGTAGSSSSSSKKGSSGSSSSSSKKSSSLVYSSGSATPYIDAYNKNAKNINANYDARVAAEKAAYNDYLASQATARNAWLQNQANQRTAYLANAQKTQDANLSDTNAGYDQSARQNYINYMQAQKRLPSELNALGVRGGASESSLIRLGTNYGTNVANNESARETALAQLRRQYEQTLADYETEYRNALASYDDTYNNRISSYQDSYRKTLADLASSKQDSLNSAYATAVQNQLTWEKEQADLDMQRFSGAIEGLYNKPESYQKLIDKLKDSNDPNKKYKIMLARREMNKLKAAQKSSSGGGGSSRSYGGSSSSYSSGGSGDGSGISNEASAAAKKASSNSVGQYYSTGKGSSTKTKSIKGDTYYVTRSGSYRSKK